MKYAIIIPDGGADEPIDELDDKTPFEAANTPNIDWISTNGRQGTVVNVPDGFEPNSDVATMTLLGYDPKQHYGGRAPIEAIAKGIALGAKDIVFRCNLVTIADETMEDFAAGHIRSTEAAKLIEGLNNDVAPTDVRFHAGVSYRHLAVFAGGGDIDVQTTAPHNIPNKPIAEHLPRGKDAGKIRAIMERGRTYLESHEINAVRRDLGENPANAIWLWGQGKSLRLPSFESRFGVRGACVAAVDLIRGLGKAIGFDLIAVPGATGFLDTNYRGKGDAAVAALDDHDLVVVHIESPDEAGHLGDARAKIDAIEQIDEHIVGPLLERIRAFDRWKIMVAPDHPTPVGRRVHTADATPFCIAGESVFTVLARPFSEANARASDLHCDPGHELIEYFLKK